MTDVKDTAAALANLDVGDSDAIDNHAKHNGGNVLFSTPSTTYPSLPAAYPKVLTIDIGGRKFRVSRAILEAESGLFRHQLSEHFTWEPDENGSYFLDADPNVFEHLLRFMRRPEVFPLFYNHAAGFDYDLYNRLEAEAEYFQIDALYEWIKAKKYLEAIKIKTGSPITRSIDQMCPALYAGNKSEDWHIIQTTRKVYLCPRQIAVHKGHPEMCGGACHRRQAENVVVYEDQACLLVVSIEKEIVLDDKVCRAE